MAIRRSWRSLIRVAYALIAIGTLHTTAASAPPAPPVQLLAGAIVGRPAMNERAVFWSEIRGQRTAILGYDLGAGARFVVAERAGMVLDLATDGPLVAWTEHDTATGQFNIFGADLRTHTVAPILSLARWTAQSEIALEQGVLYYT